ncbi:MAG: citrate synthase family protein [Rhizobiaceae bacterium]|nr:citrate synthase family protein [Rhizobiaceae bacterium]
MSDPSHYLDAEAAAESLGVGRATLYAYVSRGLIRTTEATADPRRRLYSRQDIEQLKKKKSVGRRPREVAAATLDWGLPVLPSTITLIENGRLFYRGRDAAAWSQRASLEQTARLLWECGENDPFVEPPQGKPAWNPAILAAAAALPLTERCQMLLPLVEAGRATAWQRDGRRLWKAAASLLRATAAAAVAGIPDGAPVHEYLAKQWNLDPDGADVVRQALVLLADHELNASAFAIRVVASTGASLGASLNAGLSALSGPLHGGTTSLVEQLFDEIDATDDIAALVEQRLRRGDGMPGFGHPLYPNGDPRAKALLARLPESRRGSVLTAIMADSAGRHPNIDFALVSARRILGLPEGSALALFAIGRCVGWMAHALEQHGEDRLIRPRARYIGIAPGR